MVARDPSQQAQAYVDQGLDYFDEGNIDAALQCLERALQFDPQHGQAWYCKGTMLGELGDFAEAIKCYDQSAQFAPDHAHLPLFNMGNAYQELQLFDLALECFSRATSANPEMADAWINRGRLLDDRGDHLEAVQCYDRALQIDSADPMAWTNRGNSLAALGECEAAGQSYQSALAIDPADPIARLGIASCVARLGDPAEGLRLLEQIPELSDCPPWLVERATMLVDLERWEEALETIERAVDVGGDVPEVWNNRGEILAKQHRPHEALQSFERALKLDPRFTPAWFGKARLLFQLEQVADATRCLEQFFKYARSSDSNYVPAQRLGELCGAGDGAEHGVESLGESLSESRESASNEPLVIPEEQLPTTECPCCQADVLAFRGSIRQADQNLGTYWISLPQAHPGICFLAIRRSAAETLPARVMVMQSQVNAEGITLWVVDLDDTPWADFGETPVLSRAAALAAEDKDLFFALADLVNVSDPRLAAFVRENLGQ